MSLLSSDPSASQSSDAVHPLVPADVSVRDRPAPQSGIERRRALAADRAVPDAEAHLELPRLLLPAAGRTGRAGRGVAVRGVASPRELADVATPFSGDLAALLFGPDLDEVLEADQSIEPAMLQRARRLAERAYPAGQVSDRATDASVDHGARDELHRALLACYQMHVRLPHQGTATNQFHPFAVRMLTTLERPWERDLLARARRTAARLGTALDETALPSDPDAFVEWYKRAAFTHPLYEHPLYAFLAGEADRGQLERFLRLEAAGEAAFDDLVALGQVGTRGEVKIEMGRNYWDELGNGKSHAVHTHLFHRLTEGLGITAPEAHELPWPVLAGANLMLWSCIPRRNAFRAQGTLGAVELLAPQRCTRLVTGAQRVGITKRTMSYYSAHAIIDVGHAEGWLDHVVKPQVAAVPEARVGIAEGLLARADASLDYFDYAMAELTQR